MKTKDLELIAAIAIAIAFIGLVIKVALL